MDSNGLARLYVQVDSAQNPYEALGISNIQDPTSADVRSAYRRLALVLHPDKAPTPALVETHIRLFQKLQEAQDRLLKPLPDSEDQALRELKALTEGPLSLQQRNSDFKAKLRESRNAAIETKHMNEEARKTKAQKAEGVKQEREEQSKQWEEQCREARDKSKAAKANPGNMNESIKKAKQMAKEAKRGRKVQKASVAQEKRGRNVKAVPDDVVAMGQKDREETWNASLLSGVPATISFEEKVRRENTSMAKELRIEKAEDVDTGRQTHLGLAKGSRRGVEFK